jgi:DNA polymerase-3 subunit epsilon
VLDILVLDRHIDKWRKGGRKLTDLCAVYGVTLDDAHDACADADASLGILAAMVARAPQLASLEVGDINDTVRGWYQTWLRDFSGYLEKKGESPVNEGRYSWPILSTH